MAAEAGRFVNDHYPEGLRAGLLIRSTVPRGSLLSISYPPLPSEMTMIAADSIPGKNRLSLFGREMPLLASGRISYEGEPILLLSGPDERDLRDFAASIEIRYAEESPLTLSTPADHQVVAAREVLTGEIDRVLSEAFQVVEGEYSTSAQAHVISDAHGALAWSDGDLIRVIAPTQWRHHVQATVAAALGLPLRRVAVDLPAMSPHRDSRIWFPSLVAAHAALLSAACGAPVKLLLSREEAHRFGPRGAPARMQIRTGIDREGRPTVHDISLDLDGGAYPLLATELLERAILAAGGLYRTKYIRIRARVIATSTPPMDAYLGLGTAQGAFASETHASRIAELSQTDPFSWKRENLLSTETGFASGGTPASLPPSELLAQVADRSDFRRKHAAYETLKKRRDTINDRSQRLRGIGLAVAFQGSGLHGRGEETGSFSVIVRLEADSKLVILTSGVSVDGISRQIWQDTAWRILGIERKNIICSSAWSEKLPDSGPSAFSRNITIIDSLVARCCQTIARRRFRAGLPIEVKRSYRIPRSQRWSPDEMTGLPYGVLSWATAVVEVEVLPITFETEIRGIWMAVAAGELLNPAIARRTIENGIFHALWWCSSTYGSLQRPKVPHLPPISIEFLTPEARSPSAGIEELPGSAVPSAYVSAVAQATGRYFDSLPITPELIHRYTEDL